MYHPTAKKGIITSRYGIRGGAMHAGIDIAYYCQLDIFAAWEGKVIIAAKGYNNGAGNYIQIKHRNGYTTRYLHLLEIYVKPNQRVAKGQKIGKEGNTGYSSGCHLHFEIWNTKGQKIDPEPFLKNATLNKEENNNILIILALLIYYKIYNDD